MDTRARAPTVRDMTEADLEQVAMLLHELGYPPEPKGLAARFALLRADPREGLYVAERTGVLLGCLHASVRVPLESKVHAEIVALSVRSDARRTGAGRALVERARTFARDRSLAAVRVRSNVTRDVSHVFYTSLGFARTKTQHVYELEA